MTDGTQDIIDKAHACFDAMEAALEADNREEAERQFEQGWFLLQSSPEPTELQERMRSASH